MRNGVLSAVDPFIYSEPVAGSFFDPTGRVISTPVLTPGESTLVLIVAGQSNAANNGNGFWTPTNATKIDNLNFWDGGVYRAYEPLLGCTNVGGNLWYPFADKVISAGMFQRVILVPIAINGTEVARWASGGDLNQKIIVACRRCTARGLTPTAFAWMQGEQDKFLGTSQASYQASLSSVIATPRAIGYNQPWFIGKCTYGSGSTSSTIRAAQAAVVNGTDIFAGADTDTLTGTAVYRNVADNTHLTAAGQAAAADLWKTAFDAVF